ncbi:MAG TPA: hypothetical protein PL169_06175, partial [Leptospiraceae bacterium]|nr:hypothetical protein [Leptospiraceae bacterium]
MKFLLFSISFLFIQAIASAKEAVILGTLIGSGQYMETDKGDTYALQHSDLARELTEITGKKVRILCEIEGINCTPVRYEIAPFA